MRHGEATTKKRIQGSAGCKGWFSKLRRVLLVKEKLRYHGDGTSFGISISTANLYYFFQMRSNKYLVESNMNKRMERIFDLLLKFKILKNSFAV